MTGGPDQGQHVAQRHRQAERRPGSRRSAMSAVSRDSTSPVRVCRKKAWSRLEDVAVERLAQVGDDPLAQLGDEEEAPPSWPRPGPGRRRPGSGRRWFNSAVEPPLAKPWSTASRAAAVRPSVAPVDDQQEHARPGGVAPMRRRSAATGGAAGAGRGCARGGRRRRRAGSRVRRPRVSRPEAGSSLIDARSGRGPCLQRGLSCIAAGFRAPPRSGGLFRSSQTPPP